MVTKRWLRAIDPNDDPSAEPLSPVALAAVVAATVVSTYFFLRWKIQPMQDTGLHISFVAIIADYGKDGSIYPAIYKPHDWLNTNTLLYSIAGLLGKAIGAPWGFRLTMALAVAGIPLANLYALRTFGRSAWSAVIAVPLTYNIAFVYGFDTFLFAGPLAILALPLFYRALVRPTKLRVLAIMVVMLLLSLTHFHVYVWTGCLLVTMTLVAIGVTTRRMLAFRPSTKPWTIAGLALASVAPSLLVFARWLYRSTRPAPTDELTLFSIDNTAATFESYRAGVQEPSVSFANITNNLRLTHDESTFWFFVGFVIVVIGAIGIARLHTWRRPPVLEIACAMTLASYFLLPESFANQQVIASRQLGFGLWFAAAFFTPVPFKASPIGRALVIASVSWLTVYHLSYWGTALRAFERNEVAGLEQVLAAAPKRKRLHYVNLDPISKYFNVRSFWHVDKWYMAERQGQCDENPAYSSAMSIRYRSSYPIHRITHHGNDWPRLTEIWDNYDLVLVRRWRPSPADLELANKRGRRVARYGDWDLWESKHDDPK